MLTQEDIDAFAETGSIDAYAECARKTAIYPGQGTPLGLAYCALKLNGEAGELAEHVGKAMRDDDLMPVYDATNYSEGHATETPHEAAYLGGALKSARRQLIIKEIGDVLWYLAALSQELGTSLQCVASANLTKLFDRQERAKLSGSGDER